MISIDNDKKLVTIYVGDREIELDLDDFKELKKEIIFIHEHPAVANFYRMISEISKDKN